MHNAQLKSTVQKIAEQNKVNPSTVQRAEKYAEAVDTIVSNTGVNPFQLITGEIKADKKDIERLAKKPVEIQKKIIEKVERKETNIKKELKKIKDKEKVIPEPVHVNFVIFVI